VVAFGNAANGGAVVEALFDASGRNPDLSGIRDRIYWNK
jgi:hypothetical protein